MRLARQSRKQHDVSRPYLMPYVYVCTMFGCDRADEIAASMMA